MLRKLYLLFASVFLTVAYSSAQTGLGTIRGSVRDAKSKEAIYAAVVAVRQNGEIKGEAVTDEDGKFQVNSLTPGAYTVEISNPGEGYQPLQITNVTVSSDKITFLDNQEMAFPVQTGDDKDLDEFVVVAYKNPLINKDGGASGGVVSREDIARLPVRDAGSLAGTIAGVQQNESTGDISVRGSRSDGTYYYIDGIKVRGSTNLPKAAFEEVNVITGGVPANYGDITGGIISITTRGPSAKYFGSIEGVSSGFYLKGKDPNGYDGKVFGLDKYGYNLLEGMVAGPLLMRKDSTGAKTTPILGFFLSANLTDQLDDRPLNGGSYRIKKDARDAILAQPLVPLADGNGFTYAAEHLHASDFEKTPYRMNARRTSFSSSAKIDVNTGPNVNLTFGGSLNYSWGKNYDFLNSLMNFNNFGVSNQLDYRVYGRFTQRFTNKEEGSASKIKSAFYSIMVDYSKTITESYDSRHKFDVFSYGQVGTFDITRVPTYSVDPQNSTILVQDGTKDVQVKFTPSASNPDLAAITSQYFNAYSDITNHYENLTQVQDGRGLRNGDIPKNVYGIWYNVGTPYDGFSKGEQNQFRITGSGSVNLGDHSLSLGFEFEQRNDRGWGGGAGISSSGPISLWTVARNLANFHLHELDDNNITVIDSNNITYKNKQPLNTSYAHTSGTGEYGGIPEGTPQTFFDWSLRKKLGLDPGGNDYINIDAYDPSLFTLDMFSSDELFNSGNTFIEYYGYDRTGKKVRGTTDIDDYFNKLDANGNYQRFIGSYQPIYVAGYLMDKFAFNDIVFNVGVRVDVFDANQPVLKDKYLLYSANTVAEARQLIEANPTTYGNMVIPSSMGDNYTVYVDNVNGPQTINGFRNGDTWYDKNGTVTEDTKSIRGANGIAPWIKDPDAFANKKLSGSAFQDYKRQINVMPRIAFSFPISDEASFFAHYDILTKRPTTGQRFNPIDYQFIQSRTDVINNPNLLPEKTIDYELGFQQVLSKSSALKISAFYREQRNQVQLQSVFDAFPNTYKTYTNRDFGTVKGLTVSYDLRRTGNVRMTAAYTLQFADGTGSNATSANSLIQAGLPNLRNVFPYSYDQRHTFAITFDYRYGEGADYNGPMIGDVKLFENTGLNFLTNIYSGAPYSSQVAITNDGALNPLTSGLTGTTNGSRLPWSYRLDLQLDRTFNLTFGKEDKKKTTFLNVYIRCTNLFNHKNVLSVYRATGNWNDDGYLAAAASQSTIQSQVDQQSYIDYYNMRIQNPYNISIPRTIRLGVKFDF